MSNIEQCLRCRRDSFSCEHYDLSSPCLCPHYVLPINNSKMFGRWYLFSGRIGRLEYLLTLVIAVVLYFLVMFTAGKVVTLLAPHGLSLTGLYLFSFGCMLPSVYLLIAAGFKRAHDIDKSQWYALLPLVALFFLNIFTVVVVAGGCIMLFCFSGSEGINDHGSNPTQPFDEQINLDGIV